MSDEAESITDLRNKQVALRANFLIKKCDEVLVNGMGDLDDTRMVVEPYGLSVDKSILDPTFGLDIAVMRTTGGHSNTDHVVKITGNIRKDRVEELKRAYQRRVRSSQPESRGEDRWDKPKIPGERRRRIAREKDMPQAPPEPPPSGYIVFLAQMTTKIRHDRPNEHHNQSRVIQEISKIWKYGLDDDERAYYNGFSREAREEYQRLHDEYRATGQFAPPKTYERMEKVGPWVRVDWEEKNGLERELATYETVQFPLRPPEKTAQTNTRTKRPQSETQENESTGDNLSESPPNKERKFDESKQKNDIEKSKDQTISDESKDETVFRAVLENSMDEADMKEPNNRAGTEETDDEVEAEGTNNGANTEGINNGVDSEETNNAADTERSNNWDTGADDTNDMEYTGGTDVMDYIERNNDRIDTEGHGDTVEFGFI
mmetsp:Transcript_20829/g.23789  ORF Transcript_20829/g.23789 Transcript_20829/m.23789 type:complete len:432 (-) Transcript_20829:149-1444(-)|eukprot:CAMPEP_0194184732 /NCGR_PEP_ID=MMETSP0154-20130528/39346_1 /TAXON_ID=1049557 /ORGANISM="Thalassiothrix antarctica, Strain L6-D1" /LENGTH=431 /DNA_ID=CAMNT_0038902575 /DNA_START=16 /DNA_END=1311 /DNA_ORIENTATION=-